MGQTVTEKILAAHSGQKEINPGDIVMADLDLVVDLDMSLASLAGIKCPLECSTPTRLLLWPIIPSPHPVLLRRTPWCACDSSWISSASKSSMLKGATA